MGIDEERRYTWDGKVWKRPLPRVLSEIGKLGFEGFEGTEGDIRPYSSKLGEFREFTQKNGLQFISVWATLLPKDLGPNERPALNPRLPYSDPRQFSSMCISEFQDSDIGKDVKDKRALIKMVSEAGGEFITVGGPFMLKEHIRESHYRKIGEMLDEMGEEAAAEGLKIAYHPHLSTIAIESGQVDMLFDNVSSRAVGICMDPAHLTAVGEDVVRFIKRRFRKISHVHLKDLLKGQFVELGTGELALVAIMKTLRDNGYRGWLVAELDVPNKSALQSAKINKNFLDVAIQKLRIG